MAKRSTENKLTSKNAPKRVKISEISNSQTTNKRSLQTSTQKPLGRKEKLEAAKKANQAMMKVWQLISQRKDSDAQDHL
ncbi:MAG: hypothetical protein HC916_01200 [Coleofasciculaceae cyanobacterium SM2_1_6]|nr:hypothetical protein [Coleofasciculaceae cyanobacterium SM2_1_6]